MNTSVLLCFHRARAALFLFLAIIIIILKPLPQIPQWMATLEEYLSIKRLKKDLHVKALYLCCSRASCADETSETKIISSNFSLANHIKSSPLY